MFWLKNLSLLLFFFGGGTQLDSSSCSIWVEYWLCRYKKYVLVEKLVVLVFCNSTQLKLKFELSWLPALQVQKICSCWKACRFCILQFISTQTQVWVRFSTCSASKNRHGLVEKPVFFFWTWLNSNSSSSWVDYRLFKG